MNTDNILYETDNLHKPWTWIKRVALFLFVLVSAHLYPNAHFHYEWLRHAIPLAAVLVLLLLSKQELGVDHEYLYIRDVSLIPFLSKSRKLRLDEIENIHLLGAKKKRAELCEFMAPGGNGFAVSKLEVVYRDHSTERFSLSVDQADLEEVVKIARAQMKAHPCQQG